MYISRPINSVISSVVMMFALCLIIPPSNATGQIYVDSVFGTDSSSGTDILYPMATIQAAVNRAMSDEQIIVSGGIYAEQITLTKPGIQIIADETMERPKLLTLNGNVPTVDVITTCAMLSGLDFICDGEIPAVRLEQPEGCVVTSCKFISGYGSGGLGIEINPYRTNGALSAPVIGLPSEENEFDLALESAISVQGKSWSVNLQPLDIKSNYFGNTLASGATSTESLIIENLIVHGVDSNVADHAPLFSWNERNAYIANPAHGTDELLKALAITGPGWTINVGPGKYHGLIHVDSADQIIKAITVGNERPSITGGIRIQAPGVTIDGFEIHVDSTISSAGISLIGNSQSVGSSTLLNNHIDSLDGGSSQICAIMINNKDAAATNFSTIIQGNTIGSDLQHFPGKGISLTRCLGVVGGLYPPEGNKIYVTQRAISIYKSDHGMLAIQGNLLQAPATEKVPLISVRDAGKQSVLAIQRNNLIGYDGLEYSNSSVRGDGFTIEENSFAFSNSGIRLESPTRGVLGNNTFEPMVDGSTAICLKEDKPLKDMPGDTGLIIAGNHFLNSANSPDVTAISLDGTFNLDRLSIGTEQHPNKFAESVHCILKGSGDSASGNLVLMHNEFGLLNIMDSDLTDLRSRFCGAFANGKQIVFTPLVQNRSIGLNYNTIQAALDDPRCVDGNNIVLSGTTFTEILDIRKSISLSAAYTTAPAILNYPFESENQPSISLNAPFITLKNLRILTDGNLTSHAITAKKSQLSKIELDSVEIINRNSTSLLFCGLHIDNSNRIAVSTMIRNCSFGPADSVSGNLINAVILKGCIGDFGNAMSGNRIITDSCGLQVFNPSNGEFRVEGNEFIGGGVTVSEPDVTAQVIIRKNRFETSPLNAQALLIKHNYSGALVEVSENSFENHLYRAILSAGSGNVFIKNNRFQCSTPTPYRRYHIELNTDWPGLRIPPYHANSASITGNHFDGMKASAIYVGNGLKGYQQPDFATIEIGKSGEENYFAASLERYVDLADIHGYEVSHDINAENNFFESGSAYRYPRDIPAQMQFDNEQKTTHKLDNINLGLVSWTPGVLYVPQDGDAVSEKVCLNAFALASRKELLIVMQGGIYSGATPVLDNVTSLTLSGTNLKSQPKLMTGLMFKGRNSNVTLTDITIGGRSNAPANSVVFNEGNIENLQLSDVTIAGNSVKDQHGMTGGRIDGNIKITNSIFAGILGWSVLDTDCTGNGSSLASVVLSNNRIVNCAGQIHFRTALDAVSRPKILIDSNQFIADRIPSVQYTPLKLSHYDEAIIENNSWTGFRSAPLNPGLLATVQLRDGRLANINNNVFEGGDRALSVDNSLLEVYNNRFSDYTSIIETVGKGQTRAINFTNNVVRYPQAGLGDITDFVDREDKNWIYSSDGSTTHSSGKLTEIHLDAKPVTVEVFGENPLQNSSVVVSSRHLNKSTSMSLALFQHDTMTTVSSNADRDRLGRLLYFNASVPAGDFIGTICISYSTAEITSFTETQLYLAEWDAETGKWVPAVTLNKTGRGNWQGASIPITPNESSLGKYGIDPTNNVAWAVIDHCGVFTIRNETGTNAIPVRLSEFQID